MMLSEQQRFTVDDRSIGDLFFAAIDELRDFSSRKFETMINE
jgi:hypothetical protein